MPYRPQAQGLGLRCGLIFGLALAELVCSRTRGAEPMQGAEPDLTALSFEELAKVTVDTVYAASRRVQKVTDVPASVSLVTGEEIRAYGHRTLAEVLRSVRGIDVSMDRNYGYIGVRGFNRPGDLGGRVLILIDGHRLNDSVFDSAYNVMDFILDVDLIERVEVVRGPGSTIYGNNAFFGVINVVTRKGRVIDGAELAGSYGSFDTYTGRVTYGNLFKNGVELALSGSFFDSEGEDRLYYREFDNALENFGYAEAVDGERAASGFGSLSYRGLTLEGGYSKRDKTVPTASYGTIFNDSRLQTMDSRAFVSVRLEHEFPNELSVMGRVYYDHMEYEGLYPYAGDPESVMNLDAAFADWAGLEVQATKTIADAHKLTLGAEYRYDFRMEQINFDIDPAQEYLASNEDRQLAGVYGQGEVKLRRDLALTAGVRYDYFSTFGGTINPRGGLVYEPVDNTILKLLYGQAFRAPNAYELFYESPNGKDNPDLDPETVRTYEAILEQYFGKAYRASLSGFYIDARDLINQEVDPLDGFLIFRNRDRVHSFGVETELEAKWENGVRARASYTYQRAEDKTTGAHLSNSPDHLGKANVIVPLYKEKLFTGLELQASGSRVTLAGNEAGAFAVVNATLYGKELLQGLDLSVSVYNIFGEQYYFPGAGEHRQDLLGADGRTFRVKAAYRF